MKKTLIFLTIMILLTSFTFAQDIDRMLRQFDNDSYIKGEIVVSFKDITKQQAIEILNSYDLKIKTHTSCLGSPVTSDPGETPQPQEENDECITEDLWSEGIKAANVEVPEGKEKEFAETLIENSNIIWVEPGYASVATGGNNESPERNDRPYPLNQSNNSQNSSLLKISISIIILAIIVWIIIRVLKKNQ
jgi:hypothetical protein